MSNKKEKPMALIKCTDVVLGYENKTVVEGLNFEVNTGDYLCVVGENGSGKTTIMKALLGLNTPISGNIVFGDGLKKNEIGYLPQQNEIQRDFPASVYEVVISGCLNKLGRLPFYTAAQKSSAKKNIELLGLSDHEHDCYRELSGGLQQRVLLARALCASSKLLLLDEPVTGLDPMITVDLYNLIKKLNSDGISIIMISHDVSAVSHASHILHVGHTPLFFGKTEDYLKSAAGRDFASRSDSSI